MKYLSSRQTAQKKEEDIQRTKKLNEILAILKTNPYHVFMHKQDLDLLKLYREGKTEELSSTQCFEMQIYSVLKDLGFKEEEVGTFLYKEIIVNASRMLNGEALYRGECHTEENLLKQMTNPYSQFYIDIASNDLEVGAKSFHSIIKETIDKIDESTIKLDLLKEIFTGHEDAKDYGEQAFYISKHIKNTLLVEKKAEEQKLLLAQ